MQTERTHDDGPRSEEAEWRPRRRTALLTAVILGIAVVVAVGSTVLVHRSATRSDGNAVTRDTAHPGPGSADPGSGSGRPFPSRPAIPGVDLDTVVQQVKTQINVPMDQLGGHYTGHLVDPVLGTDFRVTVFLANAPNTLEAIDCYFVQPGAVITAKMIDTAARCVTLGVPPANRAAVMSWLTSTGPKVSNGQTVQRDFGADHLTILWKNNTFSNAVFPVGPASASPSAR